MLDPKTAKLSRAISKPGRRGPDLDAMRRVLRKNPELINQMDPWKKYPLTHAALSGDIEAVKFLLKAGANVHAVDETGKTALHRVAAHADTSVGKPIEVVKVLIAAGADVHARDGKLFTPLRWAMTARKKVNLGIVKALIAAGADVNAAGKFVNVLMVASDSGSPEMVRALIAAGAEVNATMHLGTPLTQAAEVNRADNVAVLLEHGADGSFRLPADFDNAELAGKTALDVAREKKAKKVIQLLEAQAGQSKKPRPAKKPK
jgi:ankyrin repeat protein